MQLKRNLNLVAGSFEKPGGQTHSVSKIFNSKNLHEMLLYTALVPHGLH
jgi:hypothetical protein